MTQQATNINGNALFTYDTTRNNLGKIITKTETIAGQSIQYEYNYDADGRLIKANSVETYQYDDDGYLISQQDTQGKITYEYGIFGELKKVVLPDGKVIEYLHNAKHQRIAKKVNSVITEKYLWLDLTTLLAVYDKDDNLLMRFNYADNRMPLSMQKGGQQYYLHYDQIGTLKLVSDNAGNIVKQVDYDSYGNVLSDSDTNFKVPFGFAGGLYDQDTQLVRFGYRDYDAFSGRWMAKDPIGFAGGDMNLYGYVLGDPIDFVDLDGLETYQCRKALSDGDGSRLGPDISGNLLYHQYSCVRNKNGTTCGGQDRSGSFLSSPGKPSNDIYDPKLCKKVRKDDILFETCMIDNWNKPRPRYGIPFGTDCQEYDDGLYKKCSSQK